MAERKKLIAGNWKMNGLKASVAEIDAVLAGAGTVPDAVELAICPPVTLAGLAAERLCGSVVSLGGQDCHAQGSGAHTGDVSAEMWVDLGARYVIVGHSERRAGHCETDAAVAARPPLCFRAGVTPIICVGESLSERDEGRTLAVVSAQLSASVPAAAGRFVIAYEPVWAIGTGRTPTLAQVAEVHAALRSGLAGRFGAAVEGVRLLYGGSVKPENAGELMRVRHVDGALVGGASLRSADFLAIAAACG